MRLGADYRWHMIGSALAFALVMWVLMGCASIKVPDVPICRPLRTKTEKKVMKDIGEVTLTRGNPLCMKETGSPQCLYCTSIGTGKETYVSDSPDHMIEISGKKKTYSLIMKEGSVLPVESWVELRTVFINSCKQYGCTQDDIGRWQAKMVRFSSIGEALK